MLPDPNDRYLPHRRGGLLRGVTIAIALVAVTVFVGLIGYTYLNRGGDGPGGTAPLIKADTRPMKTAPDKPGGMVVPHQDKEIYARLGRDGAPPDTPRVERLLPPPETPMERPRPANAPPPLEPSIPPEPVVTPPPGAVEVTPRPVAPPQQAQSASPPAPPPAQAAPPPPTARPTPPPATAQAPSQPPAQQQAQAQAQAQAPARAVAPAAVAPAAGGGRYRVQLAALRTNEDAGREWEKMKRAHPDLLGALALNVVRADLGDRGTFYRIQAGPLADESTAKDLCRRLSEKKVGCLVVRP
jgi:cell division septation protein DedD